MTRYIPNFNTLSTLLDRLSIENVKLAHFENSIEHDNPPEDEVKRLRDKTIVQKQIISDLKEETATFMKTVFENGEYAYSKEERTFH